MNKIYNHYKFDYLVTSNYDNYEEIVDASLGFFKTQYHEMISSIQNLFENDERFASIMINVVENELRNDFGANFKKYIGKYLIDDGLHLFMSIGISLLIDVNCYFGTAQEFNEQLRHPLLNAYRRKYFEYAIDILCFQQEHNKANCASIAEILVDALTNILHKERLIWNDNW